VDEPLFGGIPAVVEEAGEDAYFFAFHTVNISGCYKGFSVFVCFRVCFCLRP
jgi:hypothetical protein